MESCRLALPPQNYIIALPTSTPSSVLHTHQPGQPQSPVSPSVAPTFYLHPFPTVVLAAWDSFGGAPRSLTGYSMAMSPYTASLPLSVPTSRGRNELKKKWPVLGRKGPFQRHLLKQDGAFVEPVFCTGSGSLKSKKITQVVLWLGGETLASQEPSLRPGLDPGPAR